MRQITIQEAVRLRKGLVSFLQKADQELTGLLEGNDQAQKELVSGYNQKLAQMKKQGSSYIASIQGRLRTMREEASRMQAVIQKREDSLAAGLLRRKEAASENTAPMHFQLKTIEDCSAALEQIRNMYVTAGYMQESGSAIRLVGDVMNRSKRAVVRKNVAAFSESLEELEPEILDRAKKNWAASYSREQKRLQAAYQNDRDALQQKQKAAREQKMAQIAAALDALVSKEAAAGIVQTGQVCLNVRSRVNIGQEHMQDMLMYIWTGLFLTQLTKHQALIDLAADRFKGLVGKDGRLMLPAVRYANSGSRSWLLAHDGTDDAAVYKFVQDSILTAFSLAPAGSIKLYAADPENRGKSLGVLYDIHQKYPDAFELELCTGQAQTRAMLERLGRQCDDSASRHGIQTGIVVLFGFTGYLDEDMLRNLEAISRFGPEAGLFTIVTYYEEVRNLDRFSSYFKEQIGKYIRQQELIYQGGGMLLSDDCPLITESYSDSEAKQFLLRYAVSAEARKENSRIMPAAYQNVSAGILPEMLQTHRQICLDSGITVCTDTLFPEHLVLGELSYPAALFGHLPWYRRLLDQDRQQGPDSLTTQLQTGDVPAGILQLPLAADLARGMHFVVDCRKQEEIFAFKTVRSLVWSMLSQIPVSLLHIYPYDSLNGGDAITPVYQPMKLCSDIFPEGILTQRDKMRRLLDQLAGRIDRFKQEVRGTCRNFAEYNRSTQGQPEAASLLIVYNYPQGLTQDMMEMLEKILRDGGANGVYAILVRGSRDRMDERDTEMPSLARQVNESCVSLTVREDGTFMMPFEMRLKLPYELRADGGGYPENSFAEAYLSAQKAAKSRAANTFGRLVPKALFDMDCTKSLRIPVGIGDGMRETVLEFGNRSHHALILGGTGSGKSTLLHTMILSAMMHYSPDELQLYLMDFKGGTEFNRYRKMDRGHIRLLALDAMQEFGESILEALVKEMSSRQERFKEDADAFALQITNLEEFRIVTKKVMPRILVIMDEFQILFDDSANRRAAGHCSDLARKIATEGRAYGIHLVMVTQSLSGMSNPSLISGFREQLQIRIGLKCGESEIRQLFGDTDFSRIREMMRGEIGTAVWCEDLTNPDYQRFKVAYADGEQRTAYEEQIMNVCGTWADQQPMRIFEGKARIGLLDFLKAHRPAASAQSIRCDLGQPVRVDDPFAVVFDRRTESNLLICGDNSDQMETRVSNNLLIGAAMHRNLRIFCMDGGLLNHNDANRPLYEALEQATGRLTFAKTEDDILRMIDAMYERYEAARSGGTDQEMTLCLIRNLKLLDLIVRIFAGERVEPLAAADDDPAANAFAGTDSGFPADSAAVAAGPDSAADPFAALEAAFDFDAIMAAGTKPAASGPAAGAKEPQEKLLEMIRRGYTCGVFFVVTAFNWQTVRDTMGTYGSNLLKVFTKRILFAVSPSDLDMMTDGSGSSAIPADQIVYWDGIREPQKIMPYTSPDASALKDTILLF